MLRHHFAMWGQGPGKEAYVLKPDGQHCKIPLRGKSLLQIQKTSVLSYTGKQRRRLWHTQMTAHPLMALTVCDTLFPACGRIGV